MWKAEFFDALGLLLPLRCLVCGKALRQAHICQTCLPEADSSTAGRCEACFTRSLALNEQGLCGLCSAMPLPFHSMRYLWNYGGQARLLIKAMKYKPSRRLAYLAGEQLLKELPTLFPGAYWDLLLPVPSSRTSLIQRTFNQCAIFSAILSAGLRAPNRHINRCDFFTLRHVGSGRKRQAQLKRFARISNVKRAFAVSPGQVRNRRILLIDDVVTTGATSAAAARVLKDAGARRVDLLALARWENWSSYRYKINAAFGGKAA